MRPHEPGTKRAHDRHPPGQLRLQEARHLMLNQHMDAGNAGGLVGYESASQFSRVYSRLFGSPPQRDIRHMRLSQSAPRQ
jgi:transcriptional regulator GlxA family with amidase domain